jgi:6-phosphofructokinase 1
VNLPLELVTLERRKLNVRSNYWRSVLESTGQPLCLTNTECAFAYTFSD